MDQYDSNQKDFSQTFLTQKDLSKKFPKITKAMKDIMKKGRMSDIGLYVPKGLATKEFQQKLN